MVMLHQSDNEYVWTQLIANYSTMSPSCITFFLCPAHF